jgi:hypothetical protein
MGGDRIRPRGFLLRGPQARPAGLHAQGQAGRDDRPGRTDRRRQVHDRQPALPLLRAAQRRGPHQRQGLHGLQARVHPQQDRHRVTDAASLLGQCARQHPLRTAGGQRRGGGGSRQDRRGARLHRDARERLRPERGRRRQPAVGRAEAADQSGESRAGTSRVVHHGRSHLVGGHIDRSPDPARHGGAHEGTHVVRHRAPPLDHPQGEPHPRHRGRPDRRAGHARRTVESARALLPPVYTAVQARIGNTIRLCRSSRYAGEGTSKPQKLWQPINPLPLPAHGGRAGARRTS